MVATAVGAEGAWARRMRDFRGDAEMGGQSPAGVGGCRGEGAGRGGHRCQERGNDVGWDGGVADDVVEDEGRALRPEKRPDDAILLSYWLRRRRLCSSRSRKDRKRNWGN
jgi:hypothetical protein